jgi:hypothetical protein
MGPLRRVQNMLDFLYPAIHIGYTSRYQKCVTKPILKNVFVVVHTVE